MDDVLLVIRDLIDFSGDKETLSKRLRNIDWDYEGPTLVLKCSDILSVLSRHIDGSLNDQDIEWWSNAIECRDHIEFENSSQEKIEQAIHVLANPDLQLEKPYDSLVLETYEFVANR